MPGKINESSLDTNVLGMPEKSFNKLNDEQKNYLISGYNEVQSRAKDGGKLGEILGTNVKNSSIHIAFIICCVLLIFCGVDLVHSFFDENTLTSEIWNLVFPVVTLALGYIFGKGESK